MVDLQAGTKRSVEERTARARKPGRRRRVGLMMFLLVPLE
jgi:hypothetical protein